MADVGKHDSLLGTCAVLVSVATFALCRMLYSFPPFFSPKVRACEGEPDSAFLLSLVSLIPGLLWLVAWILSFLSVIFGLASRKASLAVKGVIAAAIAFLNLANFMRTDMGMVQERYSVWMLRTINTAEVTYLSDSGGAYGAISDLVRHGLIDPQLEQSHTVNSYTFEVVPTPKGYVATASPTGPHSPADGCWEYFSNEDAVVRYSKDPQKAPRGRAGKSVTR